MAAVMATMCSSFSANVQSAFPNSAEKSVPFFGDSPVTLLKLPMPWKREGSFSAGA